MDLRFELKKPYLEIYVWEDLWKKVDNQLIKDYLPSIKQCRTLEALEEAFSCIELKIAKNFLVKQLSFRRYLAGELRAKMERRCLSNEVICAALTWAEQLGYLHQEEDLCAFIDKELQSGRGPKMIAWKLQSKERDCDAAALVRSRVSQEKEVEVIKQLLSARLKRHSLEKTRTFLSRRGFYASSIQIALSAGKTLQ